MAQALGNARPRGRGRGNGLPPGASTLPLRVGPGGRRLPMPGGAPGAGNGGTPAPAGRGGGRGNGRVNPPGTGMLNPPGQGPAGGGGHPQRGVGANGKGQGAANGKGAGVGGAALPGPGGRQLEARVQSGAITQEQAQKTMQQRQTLAKALGPNWRDKLQVGGESFAQVNKQLKKNPGNAKLAAIRKKLIENRSKVLSGAQAKLQGGGGTEAPEPGGKKRRHAGAGAE